MPIPESGCILLLRYFKIIFTPELCCEYIEAFSEFAPKYLYGMPTLCLTCQEFACCLLLSYIEWKRILKLLNNTNWSCLSLHYEVLLCIHVLIMLNQSRWYSSSENEKRKGSWTLRWINPQRTHFPVANSILCHSAGHQDSRSVEKHCITSLILFLDITACRIC